VDDPERRSLEQELRDERARRRDAESRLIDLTEKAALWRRRAEERTERINRMLEVEQSKGAALRRWARAIRGSEAPAIEQEDRGPPEVSAVSARNPWPGVRSVVALSAVEDPAKVRALEAFDHRSLESSVDGDLDRADLVVIEPVAWGKLHDATRSRVSQWASQPGRLPIVIWTGHDDGSMTGLPADPTVTVASDRALAQGLGVPFLPGCFDPALHSPLVGATTTDPLEPSNLYEMNLDVIESAAAGVGFSADPGSGVAARRWAYRNHAPWVRAVQLMEHAGVSGPNPIPVMAAILVSRRPEAIPASMRALLRQTHTPAELVIGVHGAAVTSEIEEAASKAELPVELLTLDGNLTFGECLNIAAAHTSAPLLAKIDDDDHYAPAHVEDSFHALCYSGADIVGKGSYYTYVAGKDITVLRRPGQEERFIDGSANGATLVFRRHVWDAVGFPHRPRHVDTGFLRAARSLGASVYSGSRWEFCYVRGDEGHTWDAEDEVFLAGSEPAWDGYEPGRVEVPDVESS
jgi:hypothetical protein